MRNFIEIMPQSLKMLKKSLRIVTISTACWFHMRYSHILSQHDFNRDCGRGFLFTLLYKWKIHPFSLHSNCIFSQPLISSRLDMQLCMCGQVQFQLDFSRSLLQQIQNTNLHLIFYPYFACNFIHTIIHCKLLTMCPPFSCTLYTH